MEIIRDNLEMGTISKNFNWSEFEATSPENAARLAQMGVRNAVTTFEQRDAILALVRQLLQPLRELYGKPMTVNSGFRCPELNKLVGGVASSQHLKGEAADIRTGGQTETYRLARLAKTTPEIFQEIDQMILYPTFVHFSHRRLGSQRHQVLYDNSYRGRRV